jgi:hypothetical protein
MLLAMSFTRRLAVVASLLTACGKYGGTVSPEMEAGTERDAGVVDAKDASIVIPADAEPVFMKLFCDAVDAGTSFIFCEDFDHAALPAGWDGLSLGANGTALVEDASVPNGPFVNRAALRLALAEAGGSERCSLNRIVATPHARWRVSFDGQIVTPGLSGGSLMELWGVGGSVFRALVLATGLLFSGRRDPCCASQHRLVSYERAMDSLRVGARLHAKAAGAFCQWSTINLGRS